MNKTPVIFAHDIFSTVRILKQNRNFIWMLMLLPFLSSCYPLATGSIKWRIVWKPKHVSEKKAILDHLDNNSQEEKRVNIVLIIADDLGKYEVSSYGAKHIHTPNIDQIGNEGVIFKDAYVSSPVCAPSRAGILTGRNQVRFGFEMQVYDFYPSNMLEFISGKWADTEDWVINTKPVFPKGMANN